MSFKQMFTGSIRRQLILGIAVVHAVLMTIFVFDLVYRQTEFLRDQTVDQATSLAKTLAANSTSWVLASDVVGLEEVVRSQSNYPSLRYAAIFDMKGKVLGYTDRAMVGKFIADPISLKLLSHRNETVVLLSNTSTIDIAVPITAGDNQVGWSRVGIDRREITSNLTVIARDGILYTLGAILIGTAFALVMGLGLTRGIYRLLSVTEQVRRGEFDARADVDRVDELGKLAGGLNRMLDYLSEAHEELRASENRLKDFSTVSSDWLWEMGPDLKFIFVSERYLDVMGIDPSARLGQYRWDGVSDPDHSPAWRDHKAMLEAHKTFRNFEYSFLDRNGDLRYVSVSGLPFYGPDGSFAGYRGTATDMSDQKSLERNLRNVQRMEAIGQLTGGVAHDFNNLLGVLMGNLELAKDKIASDHLAQSYLDRCFVAVQRGASLTQQLLAFARKQSLSPEDIELNEFLRELLKLIERTLGEDLQVVTEFSIQPLPINVDTTLFGNAVINLAINARDAMPDGGVLTMRTSIVELDDQSFVGTDKRASGTFVRLAMTDTGSGIDEEILGQVLEPFFTTKDVGQGSGLGLSMVFGFIEQSDGYIDISSPPGQGVTVSLYLPIAHQSLQDADPGPDSHERGTQQSEKVLLVEDDEQIREVAAETLLGLGYSVVQAQDGQVALETLDASAGAFDILVTDIIMPAGISGTDLVETVLRAYPHIKILMMSGYPDSKLPQRPAGTISPKPIELLRKPFSRSDLAMALERLRSDQS